jgi:putative chitinase
VNLSPHFTLAEMTVTDHRLLDNSPTQIEISNLQRLAQFLETVKTTLGGKPVMINSAFRSKAVNDAVGSKDTSSHRLGLACDFRVPGMAPDAVVRALLHLPYDQIIREYDAWTHISISDKPRRQALIIDRQGTRPFV